MNKNLVKYAILKTLWDDTKTTYLDIFLPIIKEVIRVSPTDTISLTSVADALSTSYSLKIPQKVILSLLKKLKYQNYLIAEPKSDRINAHTYLRTQLVLNELEFSEKIKQIKSKQTHLINNIKKYIHKYYSDISWDETKIAYFLELFLIQFNLDTIAVSTNHADKVAVDRISHVSSDELRFPFYVIASFLNDLNEKDEAEFKHYLDYFGGYLLDDAICYFESIESSKSNNLNLNIYLDTPILMSLLGYTKSESTNATLEMIELFKQRGCNIKCFKHNVDEIRNILLSTVKFLPQGHDDKFYTNAYANTILFFRSKNFTKDSIIFELSILEDKIESMNVEIVDLSYSDNEYEKEKKNILVNRLKERYKNYIDNDNIDFRLQRDVNSIYYIIRNRDGLKSTKLEKIKSIFITSNITLVSVTKDFLKSDIDKMYLPPIMAEYDLATIIWLQNPSLGEDFNKQTFRANIVASLSPDSKLWSKFISSVQELVKNGRLNNQVFDVISYVPETTKILMNYTKGDPKTILSDNSYEIIRKLYSNLESSKKQNDELSDQISILRMELDALKKEKENEFNEKIKNDTILYFTEKRLILNKALKNANCLFFAIKLIFIISYIVSALISLPLFKSLIEEGVLELGYIIPFITVNLFWGLCSLLHRLKIFDLVKYLEKITRNTTYRLYYKIQFRKKIKQKKLIPAKIFKKGDLI